MKEGKKEEEEKEDEEKDEKENAKKEERRRKEKRMEEEVGTRPLKRKCKQMKTSENSCYFFIQHY